MGKYEFATWSDVLDEQEEWLLEKFKRGESHEENNFINWFSWHLYFRYAF